MAQTASIGRRLLWATIASVVLVAGAAGCARARAQTQPLMPGLDAPPPPPRDVPRVEVDVTSTTPPPASTAEEEPPPARTPPRQPARPEPARTTPPGRVEREPEHEPARPEEVRTPRTLETAASGTESERAIRDQLQRAAAELQRVDYRNLSASLKEQYDIAKRFIEQAEEALRAKNLVYAATLAGKAAEIAEVLPRR